MGPREELDTWAHMVHMIGKIAKRHPQLEYSGLWMSLQVEWHYLKITVPRVGALVGPIEYFFYC